MKKQKTKVLILVEWFSPGYRAGGPIRSVANLVAGLRDHCDFAVVTTNRDLGVAAPYPDLPANRWVTLREGLEVIYYAPEMLSFRELRSLLRKTSFDVLYLNGIFSLKFTLYPLWIARRLKKHQPVILAPRGMLNPDALALKKRKKRVFLSLIRNLTLHKQILFHATKEQEVQHIQDIFGTRVPIHLAPNLPSFNQPPWKALPKEPGELRIICLARIHEIKNLLFLIRALHGQTARIQLDFVGPYEQPDYWQKCEAEIAKLPAHLKVRRLEAVQPAQVPELLRSYHIFALPTLGENFGHSIFEALSAGKPVLISDRTPWQNLEARQVGWAIPLEQPEAFADAITQAANMSAAEYATWSKAAWEFVAAFLADPDLIGANIQLFCQPEKEGNGPT